MCICVCAHTLSGMGASAFVPLPSGCSEKAALRPDSKGRRLRAQGWG